MKLNIPKIPMMIAALVTALSLGSVGAAQADRFPTQHRQISEQVTNVDFRFSKGKHSIHRGHGVRLHRGFSNQRRVQSKFFGHNSFRKSHRVIRIQPRHRFSRSKHRQFRQFRRSSRRGFH